jgi:hypothetical protein
VAAAALASLATAVAALSVGEPVSSRLVTTEFNPFRVAVRSAVDGRVLRVLEYNDHDHPAHDVVVSLDGSTVYFNRVRRFVCPNGQREGIPEIVRVPIEGGPVEPLHPTARGVNLAITPDGTALTYNSDATGTGCGEKGHPGNLLVRRDLTTGETRTLIDPRRDGVAISEHSWTPDGNRLLGEGYLIVDGIPRLLRVDFHGGVRATPLKDNHDFPKGVAVSEDTYAASYLDDDGYHIASFDFDATFRRILFDFEAAFLPRVDLSGRHFLYVLQGQGREPSTLVAWSVDSGRRELGTAFVQDVAWVPNG